MLDLMEAEVPTHYGLTDLTYLLGEWIPVEGGMTGGVINRQTSTAPCLWLSIDQSSNTTSEALRKKDLHVYMHLGRWQQKARVDRDFP